MNVLQYLATKELNLLTYNSSLLNISSFQIIKKNLKPAWKKIESVWNYNFFGSRRREFRLSSRCMKSESEGAGREPNLPVDIPSLANERGLLPFRCCSCSSCCSEVAGWSIRTRIWSSDVRQISFLLRNSPCPSPRRLPGSVGIRLHHGLYAGVTRRVMVTRTHSVDRVLPRSGVWSQPGDHLWTMGCY